MLDTTQRELEMLQKVSSLDNPTAEEVAQNCDVKKSTVQKYMSRLKEKGALETSVDKTVATGRPPYMFSVTEVGEELLQDG